MTTHFLSGLPRSGSTLLAAILNQHPQVYVSPTSGLIDLMGSACAVWEQNPAMAVRGRDKDELLRLLRSIMAAKYEHIKKPVIVDKSRGWPAVNIMNTMTDVLGAPPKIVATVRSVPDCAASFVRVAKPDDVKQFLRESPLIAHLKSSYTTLAEGFKRAPENFCIVDYDVLLRRPKAELGRIVSFLGLESFTFDLKNIDGEVVAERDEEAWNIVGLHDIKPKLARQRARESRAVLGDLHSTFLQPEFWEPGRKKPAPQLIDIQHTANLRGDFDKGWEIAQHLERVSPGDDRAAFNRGWHLLHQGRLREGMMLLNRGRAEGVFGNRPLSRQPLWNGRSGGDVLLVLEGGFGDQIHQIRFARDIAQRGCRVIVSCSPELAPLIKNCAGVSAVCQHGAEGGVYHDSWVAGMSAVVPLGYEYPDIDGRPYIGAYQPPSGRQKRRLKVGLCWQGNPRFEEEQYRLFDPTLLFNAVKGADVDFVSLQRDEGEEARPQWAARVPLDTWEHTARAIAELDLVISSCTSVAHLSGAMGVPTWVIVPVMPYFIWALPGAASPWYDSVRLFRQKKFGDWRAPFAAIRRAFAALKSERYKKS